MTCWELQGTGAALQEHCDKAAAIHLLPPAQNSKHINLRYCGQKGAEGGKESQGCKEGWAAGTTH